MAVDEETKRRIIDLHSNEYITIREISKIVKKSSRDIISVLRKHESQKYEEDGTNDTPKQKEEAPDKDLAPYTKAYKLFSEGKKPKQAALILKHPEAEVTTYYIEYLRMTQLPELPQIFKELGVKGISVFLILTRKALAENLGDR
jgi:hypothetical protein